MLITLYASPSERHELNKILSNPLEVSGYLRAESEIISPSFVVEVSNPSSYNYCYIPIFGRYYYITEMISVRSGLWRLSLSVDVLMSFKDQILNLSGVISDYQNSNNNYINGSQWVANCKHTTSIVTFPSGLPDTGQFILITAGG